MHVCMHMDVRARVHVRLSESARHGAHKERKRKRERVGKDGEMEGEGGGEVPAAI
jgi:hypothetical protein